MLCRKQVIKKYSEEDVNRSLDPVRLTIQKSCRKQKLGVTESMQIKQKAKRDTIQSGILQNEKTLARGVQRSRTAHP